MFLGALVAGAGAVAGGASQLMNFWQRVVGSSTSAGDSYTVKLPAGLSFRQAVSMLAADADAAARFDPNCGSPLLDAPVVPGTIKAATTLDLMEQLRYRLPRPMQNTKYKIQVLLNGGVYEVTCSP
jgi:hypothetical protein